MLLELGVSTDRLSARSGSDFTGSLESQRARGEIKREGENFAGMLR
jgi:hypothetical protein